MKTTKTKWLAIYCPCCDSPDVRADYDFPETMACCEHCGADFMQDGEVIMDPSAL